jgi:hypothetical protein
MTLALPLVGLLTLPLAAPSSPAPAVSRDPESRLSVEGYLTTQDRALLARNGVVAKVLDASDRSEIKALVVLRTTASESQFMECVRDPRCFKGPGDILAAGQLASSVSPRDFSGVTLDGKQLRYLSRCRVRDCDMKLSDEDMDRFQKDIDWTASGSHEKAEDLFRRLLARYATAYLQQGDVALPVYSDAQRPASSRDKLRGLFQDAAPVLSQAPELLRYVEDFPKGSLSSAEQFLCWHKERLWKENFIGLNHMFLYRRADGEAQRLFVVSKQLYASNYYEASLELTEFFRRPDQERSTVVFLSCSHTDIGPDGFGFIERFLLRRLVPAHLRRRFRSLQERLDQANAAARPSTRQN